MKTNNKDGIYRVIAGNPKEEDKNEIFLRENIAFEEADRIFDFLLEKRQYPVIMLDEGDITIRGYKEPGNVEQDYRYTKLKEDLQKRTNPGYIAITHNEHKETKEPKRKKKGNPGYER
jgi:hypothetical protein